MLSSFDPRISRLELPESAPPPSDKAALDQFPTYEVFHQRKENAAYVYVGPVHAPEADVAFLFGKEQFSRRFPCTGMWVVLTSAIQVTEYGDDQQSVYDRLPLPLLPADQLAAADAAGMESYDIFHLKKRGKAHAHVGQVSATSPEAALQAAKAAFGDQRPVVNVWVIRSADLLRSDEADRDMWTTTPDKKYREAISYKVQDRIDRFKQEG
ncbi:phenylacetic acid degradation b [Hymenobacter psychrophilus]|uniref:Ring-1,2-phenylacetyl-CoA epoxidase subunit PaaB n=1 Tax=Hymenobacter psychrophilus TaxID=651662 RepID=A0A1H3DQH8_9BACT|nr:phenylacetic acid degradation b [Hymenobacter psychrophilus]SDX67919.1 ring-1,2-phenylacetyl-CoA epoxidase subunit PaaB [Hymenobacter psychrophilus]